jgi:hypothetical protein
MLEKLPGTPEAVEPRTHVPSGEKDAREVINGGDRDSHRPIEGSRVGIDERL